MGRQYVDGFSNLRVEDNLVSFTLTDNDCGPAASAVAEIVVKRDHLEAMMAELQEVLQLGARETREPLQSAWGQSAWEQSAREDPADAAPGHDSPANEGMGATTEATKRTPFAAAPPPPPNPRRPKAPVPSGERPRIGYMITLAANSE